MAETVVLTSDPPQRRVYCLPKLCFGVLVQVSMEFVNLPMKAFIDTLAVGHFHAVCGHLL
jgi:hypothetical protein